jgi:hypothetical protein
MQVTQAARSSCGLAFVLATCLSVSAATAQATPGSAPSPGPGWRPRTSTLGATHFATTRAERAAAIERLEAVEAVLRRVPVLANPKGFEVGGHLRWIDPGRFAHSPGRNRGELFSYQYRLRFFSPSFAVSPEAMAVVVVTFNEYVALATGAWVPFGAVARTEEGQIYVEPRRIQPLRGMPPGTVVYDELEPGVHSMTRVVLTAGEEPPLVPVSAERFLTAINKEQEPGERAVNDPSARTAYEQWLSEAPNREKMLEQMPPEARKKVEATWREVGEKLKAQEAADRELLARSLPLAIGPKLRARLAAMTPEERATPAWLANGTGNGAYELAPPETPGAARLVALNPAFFRSTGSRVVVRLINVYFSQEEPHEWGAGPNQVVNRAIYQIYQTLDWTALARLVER